MIIFDNVTKRYGDDFTALQSVSLAVEPGEFVSVIGPSGAGKSTLLKLLYAEEFPTEGEVVFYDRPTTAIKQRLLPYYRRNFGTVFQDFKLLSQKNVFENVAFSLEVDGRTTEEIEEEVPKVLAVVGLEKKAGLYPPQLSGGEGQRVSLARALIHRPRVLIADEPTGNLDEVSAAGIMDLLLRINELGTTVLLATHGKNFVDKIQRRVVAMENGRVISDRKKGTYKV